MFTFLKTFPTLDPFYKLSGGKNNKFEFSAKTHFLVSIWAYASTILPSETGFLPPRGFLARPSHFLIWSAQLLFRQTDACHRVGGSRDWSQVPIMLEPSLGTIFLCFWKFFFTNFTPNSNQIYFNFKFRIADVWFGGLWADLRGRSRIGLLLCAVSACSLLVMWMGWVTDHRPGARSGDTRYMCILRRKPI